MLRSMLHACTCGCVSVCVRQLEPLSRLCPKPGAGAGAGAGRRMRRVGQAHGAVPLRACTRGQSGGMRDSLACRSPLPRSGNNNDNTITTTRTCMRHDVCVVAVTFTTTGQWFNKLHGLRPLKRPASYSYSERQRQQRQRRRTCAARAPWHLAPAGSRNGGTVSCALCALRMRMVVVVVESRCAC